MICTRCLYHSGIPKIEFDEYGVCTYCHINDRFEEEYPTGDEGWEKLVEMAREIRKDGKDKEYDVVVGVSGGFDSSYMLHIAKKLKLRPLAVHFDNGWNSKVAERNIQKVVEWLDVDLLIRAVDKEEYDDVCRSFLKAGVSDIDIANDIALTAVLYKAAELYRIKHVFIGHNFRTEGIAPLGWTYMDGKYIQSVHNEFGSIPFNTFPNLLMRDFIRWTKIKRHRPLYYLEYNKEELKKWLAKESGWRWYGGHHMENLYTSFQIAWFMPKRYDIDFRLLGHAARVRSKQLNREEALKELETPMNGEDFMEKIRRRLGFTREEMENFITQPRKTSDDYKTYKKTFKRMKPYWWLMYKLNRIPKSFYVKYCK